MTRDDRKISGNSSLSTFSKLKITNIITNNNVLHNPVLYDLLDHLQDMQNDLLIYSLNDSYDNSQNVYIVLCLMVYIMT